MEAEARLPVVLPFRCHCHLPLIWHNRQYITPWSPIHGQEGLIDANCICLRFTGTWAHRHRQFGTLWIVCRQDGPGPCYQNNATSCRNIEPILVLKVYFTKIWKMGVNTVVSLDFKENVCRYRKYQRNRRVNKHSGVGSQPCYFVKRNWDPSSLA